MNRQTTMSGIPYRSSERSAQAPPLALLAREEPALDARTEPAAQQVAQVVAEERADRGEGHEQRDPGIGAARRRDAERDDGGLPGQHGENPLETGHHEPDDERPRA